MRLRPGRTSTRWLKPIPRSRHHLPRRLHRNFPRPHLPQNILRTRLRLLHLAFVARCVASQVGGMASFIRIGRPVLTSAPASPASSVYPPLTWMLGAAFGLIFPWKGALSSQSSVPSSPATGLATRMLARQAMPDAPATLAGCGSTLLRLLHVHSPTRRSAFGELAGGFWIPLLLLLIFRDRNPQGSVGLASRISTARLCCCLSSSPEHYALQRTPRRNGQLSARCCRLNGLRSYCGAHGRRFSDPP